MLSLSKHLAARRIFAFSFRYARSFVYAQDDKEKIKISPLCIDRMARRILSFTDYSKSGVGVPPNQITKPIIL